MDPAPNTEAAFLADVRAEYGPILTHLVIHDDEDIRLDFLRLLKGTGLVIVNKPYEGYPHNRFGFVDKGLIMKWLYCALDGDREALGLKAPGEE